MRALSIATATAAGLGLLLSACVVERDYAPTNSGREDFSSDFGDDNAVVWDDGDDGDDFNEDDEYEDTYGYDTLPITSGRVSGDIGGVRDFDAPTDYVDAYSDYGWTSITLSATDQEGRIGMLILEVGAFSIADAPAGSYGTMNVDGIGEEIWVTGCSSSTDTYYDAPADSGEIVISDNPDGTRDVNVEATLPDDYGGASQAQARFTLE